MKDNFKFLQGHPKTLCCFCEVELTDRGHNPDPIVVDNETDRCCDSCNWNKVIPSRIYQQCGDIIPIIKNI